MKQLSYLLVLVLLLPYSLFAQTLRPITRFHDADSPYTNYANNFLSGFLQTAPNHLHGFLQIPFVGDPLLVYVGEKDSTQFMAYASGYLFNTPTSSAQNAEHYDVTYTRYGIQAKIDNHPAYSTQRFTYPDTLAEKGFLIDIDQADYGPVNEDMDIVFIDKKTVRAYKRSYNPQGESLYYVAHFSHPFNKWNIRREVVRLENGQREQRCKAALVFDALKAGEVLTVTSAVSALSTNEAYAQLHLAGGNKHFNDQRKARPKDDDSHLLAQNNEIQKAPVSNNKQAQKPTTKISSAEIANITQPIEKISKGNSSPLPWLEISTRDAEMQAAFSALIAQLKQEVPQIKKTTTAFEFIDALARLYEEPKEVNDSLLQQYAKSLFTGTHLTSAQASWFVFQSLGIIPNSQATQFRLVRPSFNVVTIQLPRTRRFILHAKNNTANHHDIQKANWQHQALTEPYTLTREQMLHGGILELKMK